jgi:protoheme IX farnesyltransferase
MRVLESNISKKRSYQELIEDYKQLVKLRLNLLVVFSTVLGYLIGNSTDINFFQLFILAFGGFLTVGAANGINQIIERDSDKLMKRTENRPVATGRISVNNAIIISIFMGSIGVFLIGFFLNQLAAGISLVSLLLYGFAYTPLKRISPISVHVGAVPGSLPPVIGYVAASGSVDTMAIFLFAIQFFWQFPHFYSIAWILDEDYSRAGLKLYPIGTPIGKNAALQILLITAILLPISISAFFTKDLSLVSSIIIFLTSAWFLSKSITLYKDLENKSAKKLMFASFLYLPIVLIVILIDKILW